MFEQFTEKAIEVMLLAQEEARRLCHNFVGTEQILLGLIGQETGIAAKVLIEMGLKLDDAQIEVEKFIGRGSGEVGDEIPFTSRAKRVLEQSLQEAEQLGHDYIGTEHLLLGLIREREGLAIRVLENFRIKPPKVRTSVLRMLADEAEKYEEQLLVSQKLDNEVLEENNSPQPDSNLGELENLQPELASNIYAGLSVDPSSLIQAEVEVPDEWEVGDRLLNLYEVTGILGTGGFGQVYKVLHTGWNISLAVKTPQSDQLKAVGGVENFIREAETWVKLGLHPHIVSCFYVRKLGKSPRVFAEFVSGGSLHDWIYSKNGESPKLYQGGQAESFKRILDIAIQFAWGLHYSHEQGLIHQDVKPGNTMMTPDGTVKVTDFGLARARPIQVSATEGSPDQTLQVKGSFSTPGYCSPEQARGDTLTRRTDIYSWAVSVLEMLKGGRRWDAGVKVAYAREFYIIESEPLQDNTPSLPQSVAELLWVCLREDPERRPRTMLDVANALKVIYQQETGEAYPRPEPETGKDIADSLNNRAMSLLDLGQLEEAMHLWDRALEVNPLHPESTYNRGLILWRAGITDDLTLVRVLTEMRCSQVENWVAGYLLALVHLEREDCKAAIEVLEGVQGKGKKQEQVTATLKLSRQRLPDSKRLLRTFEGHKHWVRSVCLSRDGSLAMSGSLDNTLKLWDVATGRCLRTFEGHMDSVVSVCLSRNGRFSLSGSRDKTLKLWEVDTGRCLQTFEGHTDGLTLVCLNGDDTLALSGSFDNTLKLWDVATGRCLHTLGNKYPVMSAYLSDDGRLAVYAFESNLKLWEVATGECLRTFEGDKDSIQSVYLSRDGKLTLSASGEMFNSQDKTLKLWDVSTGQCLRTFEGHTDGVNSGYLSRDNKFILSGSDDHTLKLWEVSNGRSLRTFGGHTQSVESVCLSEDGRFALSGSRDKTLKLWAVSSTSWYLAPLMVSQIVTTETILELSQTYELEMARAQVFMKRGDWVTAARHIHKARTQLGYNRREEALKAWVSLYIHFPYKAFVQGWESATFVGHKKWVHSLSLSQDGRFAISGSSDSTIKLWEIETVQCLQTLKEAHQQYVSAVYLSQDSKLALSGGWDETLKLWDLLTGQLLRTFDRNTGHTAQPNSVCMSADSRLALSGSSDSTIKLWDVTTGKCLRTFEGHTAPVTSVCLSEDCTLALSGSGGAERREDNTCIISYSKSPNKRDVLKVWEVSTGRCLHTFEGHTWSVASVYLSKNAKLALSGSWDSTLKLWDIATGKCLRTFEGHTNWVTSVCLSEDSRFAFSGSRDCTVKLWEVSTGKCLRTFGGHTDSVESVCLSGDGRFALSGSTDYTLKTWFLDWELELQLPAD
jgi:WD40 repeat protein/serine/threonine protein kinase